MVKKKQSFVSKNVLLLKYPNLSTFLVKNKKKKMFFSVFLHGITHKEQEQTPPRESFAITAANQKMPFTVKPQKLLTRNIERKQCSDFLDSII